MRLFSVVAAGTVSIIALFLSLQAWARGTGPQRVAQITLGGPIQPLPPAPENGGVVLKPIPTPSPRPLPPNMEQALRLAPAQDALLRVGLSTAGEAIEIYAPLGAILREKNGARVLRVAPRQSVRCVWSAPTQTPNASQTSSGPITLQIGDQISNAWNSVVVEATSSPIDSDKVRLRATSNGANARFGRPYRGNLEVFANGLPEPTKRVGPLALVNVVPLEEYLKGVVPYEMSPSAPPEALKAQAIGARTTAVKFLNSTRFKSGNFDVCDYDACQAYPGTENEKPSTTAAVAATQGLILRFRGEPIDAVYGTNSGGITASAGDVWKTSSPASYLASRPDFPPDSPLSKILKPKMSETDWAVYFGQAWDSFAKPDEAAREALKKRRARSEFAARLFGSEDWPEFYRWKRVFEADEVNAAFARLGFAGVRKIEVLERAPSGRIRRLQITGADAQQELPASLATRAPTPPQPDRSGVPKVLVLEGDGQVRAMFSGRLGSTTALPSSSFTIAMQMQEGVPTRWVLQGAGWGHGVGMCQRGAQNRARNGATAREILAFYYPGTTISML